jgi:hypothetical protein
MPYFVVEVRGDPARAAGFLALQGIQNLVRVQHTSPEGSADDAPGLMARLSADAGASAVQRVRAALEGEPFTVEHDPRPEPEVPPAE